MGLIVSILIALLNTLLNHRMLTRRKSFVFCIVAFILNSAVVMAAIIFTNTLITDTDISKYFFVFISFWYIVYINLVFEESFSKKLFVMFSTWVISGIMYYISIIIANTFADPEYLDYFIYGLRISFQLILLWFVTKPLFSSNYKRILSLVQDKIMNLMSIYMIIAFLLLLNNITIMKIDLRNFSTLYDLLLFFVFIILGYVIVFTGISSSSRMVLLKQTVEITEKKSEINFKMANIDSLTGVASRLNILNILTDAIVDYDKYLQKFAVLMLDIDKFKLVNDNYGHMAGDEVLKFLTDKINGCLRETDSIGRVGGDEFLVIIRHIHSKAEIEAMIGRVFEKLKSPLVFENHEIQVSISVGISIFPDYAQNLDSLINQADSAMYEAKKTEGSSYCFKI